jgi:hypothetical protein
VKVIRYIAVLGLVGICFGILGRLFYLDWYYYCYAPRKSDAIHGLVYPANVHHGTTVYLTAQQWRWFESPTNECVCVVAFAASAFGAYALNRRWRVFG